MDNVKCGGLGRTLDDEILGSGEKRERILLRPWLENLIDSGKIPGLEWINGDRTLFKVPWKHRSKKTWSQRHSSVFLEWAKNTGRWREGDPAPNYAQLKTRLRCAFNKAPDIQEMKEYHFIKSEEPYKVYRFIPRRESKLSTLGRKAWSRSTALSMSMRRRRLFGSRPVGHGVMDALGNGSVSRSETEDRFDDDDDYSRNPVNMIKSETIDNSYEWKAFNPDTVVNIPQSLAEWGDSLEAVFPGTSQSDPFLEEITNEDLQVSSNSSYGRRSSCSYARSYNSCNDLYVTSCSNNIIYSNNNLYANNTVYNNYNNNEVYSCNSSPVYGNNNNIYASGNRVVIPLTVEQENGNVVSMHNCNYTGPDSILPPVDLTARFPSGFASPNDRQNEYYMNERKSSSEWAGYYKNGGPFGDILATADSKGEAKGGANPISSVGTANVSRMQQQQQLKLQLQQQQPFEQQHSPKQQQLSGPLYDMADMAHHQESNDLMKPPSDIQAYPPIKRYRVATQHSFPSTVIPSNRHSTPPTSIPQAIFIDLPHNLQDRPPILPQTHSALSPASILPPTAISLPSPSRDMRLSSELALNSPNSHVMDQRCSGNASSGGINLDQRSCGNIGNNIGNMGSIANFVNGKAGSSGFVNGSLAKSHMLEVRPWRMVAEVQYCRADADGKEGLSRRIEKQRSHDSAILSDEKLFNTDYSLIKSSSAHRYEDDKDCTSLRDKSEVAAYKKSISLEDFERERIKFSDRNNTADPVDKWKFNDENKMADFSDKLKLNCQIRDAADADNMTDNTFKRSKLEIKDSELKSNDKMYAEESRKQGHPSVALASIHHLSSQTSTYADGRKPLDEEKCRSTTEPHSHGNFDAIDLTKKAVVVPLAAAVSSAIVTAAAVTAAFAAAALAQKSRSIDVHVVHPMPVSVRDEQQQQLVEYTKPMNGESCCDDFDSKSIPASPSCSVAASSAASDLEKTRFELNCARKQNLIKTKNQLLEDFERKLVAQEQELKVREQVISWKEEYLKKLESGKGDSQHNDDDLVKDRLSGKGILKKYRTIIPEQTFELRRETERDRERLMETETEADRMMERDSERAMEKKRSVDEVFEREERRREIYRVRERSLETQRMTSPPLLIGPHKSSKYPQVINSNQSDAELSSMNIQRTGWDLERQRELERLQREYLAVTNELRRREAEAAATASNSAAEWYERTENIHKEEKLIYQPSIPIKGFSSPPLRIPGPAPHPGESTHPGNLLPAISIRPDLSRAFVVNPPLPLNNHHVYDRRIESCSIESEIMPRYTSRKIGSYESYAKQGTHSIESDIHLRSYEPRIIDPLNTIPGQRSDMIECDQMRIERLRLTEPTDTRPRPGKRRIESEEMPRSTGLILREPDVVPIIVSSYDPKHDLPRHYDYKRVIKYIEQKPEEAQRRDVNSMTKDYPEHQGRLLGSRNKSTNRTGVDDLPSHLDSLSDHRPRNVWSTGPDRIYTPFSFPVPAVTIDEGFVVANAKDDGRHSGRILPPITSAANVRSVTAFRNEISQTTSVTYTQSLNLFHATTTTAGCTDPTLDMSTTVRKLLATAERDMSNVIPPLSPISDHNLAVKTYPSFLNQKSRSFPLEYNSCSDKNNNDNSDKLKINSRNDMKINSYSSSDGRFDNKTTNEQKLVIDEEADCRDGYTERLVRERNFNVGHISINSEVN